LLELDDLVINKNIARQKDLSYRVKYDEHYFNKCLGYEDKEIALKINKARIDLVARHIQGSVLDIGIGSGEFIKKRENTFGYDINPKAVEWLKQKGLYSELFCFSAYTFWDVIEHIERPEDYFDKIKIKSYLFTSIPIFTDLEKIRESRHYRPGEHLYYFTKEGFISYMRVNRFRLLETNEDETLAGRDSIMSFAFKKDLRITPRRNIMKELRSWSQ